MRTMNKPDLVNIDNLSKGKGVESLKRTFNAHRKYTLAKSQSGATRLDLYKSLALVVRDHLVEKWIETKKFQYDNDVKRINYLSMEYLVGRVLTQNMVNLDLRDSISKAVREYRPDILLAHGATTLKYGVFAKLRSPRYRLVYLKRGHQRTIAG